MTKEIKLEVRTPDELMAVPVTEWTDYEKLQLLTLYRYQAKLVRGLQELLAKPDEPRFYVHVIPGDSPEKRQSAQRYDFDTQAEADAFIAGMDTSIGWQDMRWEKHRDPYREYYWDDEAESMAQHARYAQQMLFSYGWDYFGDNGEGERQLFRTKEDAIKDLAENFGNMKEAGMKFDPEDYRVVAYEPELDKREDLS